MKTQNVFHFPDGSQNNWVSTSYCDAQFNIGEKITFEGEQQVFIVNDIQNQFRRMPQNEAGTELRMIIRNVILSKYEENETT